MIYIEPAKMKSMWTKVSDRLPKKHVQLITLWTYIGDGRITVGEFDGKNWTDGYNFSQYVSQGDYWIYLSDLPVETREFFDSNGPIMVNPKWGFTPVDRP